MHAIILTIRPSHPLLATSPVSSRSTSTGGIYGGEQGREEEPGVEDPGAVQVRAEQRRPVVRGGGAGVLLGVRGAGVGAVRGARRPRRPPALPAPPRRRRAGVRLRGAGAPRPALRRRRLPRRALAHGPRRSHDDDGEVAAAPSSPICGLQRAGSGNGKVRPAGYRVLSPAKSTSPSFFFSPTAAGGRR
ncbi:hypothetical protein VPH35_047057 [Triticum aestivum]